MGDIRNMKLKGLIFGIIVLSSLFIGCGVNSNLMFKEPKGLDSAKVNSDSIPLKPNEAYRIGVNDKLSFTLSTHKGTRIIESMAGISGGNSTGGGGATSAKGGREFLVRQDGEVELPVIGDISVVGKTIEQCEDTLELLYAEDSKDPFIQVKVTNRRAIVFPGSGSGAAVVSLDNPNTTLMEVIATAGGIPERGKANTIKIMRMEGGERQIYRVDLSVIEGLKFADMVIQSNDYIYVEPNSELAQELNESMGPWISLFSTAFFIVATILTIN
jgi:polysaccharide export outer membrane protein